MAWPAWLTWRRTTGLAIVGSAFVVGAYDILAEVLGGNDATISRVHLDVASAHPLFVVCVSALLGILMGHYFLPQHVEVPSKQGVVMPAGTLPDVPPSWNEMAKIVLQIVTLAAAVGSAAISSCNASKINTVQSHQEVNGAKLDAVKDHAAKVETKVDSVEKKQDAIKASLPPK